jgi:ATP-dependent protease Clp ATPase subunit
VETYFGAYSHWNWGPIKCDFCGNTEDPGSVVCLPGVFICAACVEVCQNIIADDKAFDARHPDRVLSPSAGRPIKCDSCGSNDESGRVVCGPAVSICESCVDVCRNVLADDEACDAENPDRIRLKYGPRRMRGQ